PGGREYGGRQGYPDGSLPAPVRMIGHRPPPGEFRLPRVGIEQSPMPADRPLELTLPRLVVGFYQVDAVVFTFGQRYDVVQDTRSVRRRWQGALTHAAGARPAEFAEQHLFFGKRRRDLPADRSDVAR